MYYNGRLFEDVFTHGDAQQKVTGSFYFHKSGPNSYKGGTYKGLDLVFGTEACFGGVLIRSIVDVATNEVTSGPCLCVDLLLKTLGCATIADLVAKHGVVGKSEEFRLVDAANAPAHTVSSSMRVGLSLKVKFLVFVFFGLFKLNKGKNGI